MNWISFLSLLNIPSQVNEFYITDIKPPKAPYTRYPVNLHVACCFFDRYFSLLNKTCGVYQGKEGSRGRTTGRERQLVRQSELLPTLIFYCVIIIRILWRGFRATWIFENLRWLWITFFFKFVKSCILSYLWQCHIKRWGSPTSFLSYKLLKLKLRVS